MNYKNRPELMSPAGDFSAFQAALENGADAVYLGLQEFNARKPAKNFSNQELLEAVKIAQSRSCRIYVTFNIDLKENELLKAVSFLHFVNKAKVDAVIIRDYAVLELVKIISEFEEFTPELHFSTQGGAVTTYDLKFLGKAGFSRVVMARELNYQELKEISDTPNLPEMEIFIHGSMCFSFSGKCNFSSWLGGKSANRGGCLAPCRFLYHDPDDLDHSGTFFNMKDLNLLEQINNLKQLNIKAYKIEGRLKNSGWVGAVTRFYKDLIISAKVKSKEEIRKINANLQLFSGREPATGFLLGTSNLTGANNLKFGKLLGKITEEVEENYLTDIFKTDLEFPASLRFFRDRFITLVSLRGEDDTGIGWQNNQLKLSKKLFFDKIDIDTEIFQVYKQEEHLRAKAENGKYNLYGKVSEGTLYFSLETNIGRAEISLKLKEVKKANRTLSLIFLKNELEGSFFKGLVLGKASLPDIPVARSQFKHIVKEISSGIIKLVNNSKIANFVPAIKKFQRNYHEQQGKRKNKNRIIPENINILRISFKQFEKLLPEDFTKLKQAGIINLELCDLHLLRKVKSDDFRNLIICAKDKLKVFLDLETVLLNQDLKSWAYNFSLLTKPLERPNNIIKGFVVNSQGQLEFLKELGLTKDYQLKGGDGLAVLNSTAAKYLTDSGLESVSVKAETDLRNLEEILKVDNTSYRITALGKIPLFISRVNHELFREKSCFNDKFGHGVILQQKGEWNYFYSREFFSAFTEESQNLVIGELVADFSSEADFRAEDVSDFKIGKHAFETRDFNLRRKLY